MDKDTTRYWCAQNPEGFRGMPCEAAAKRQGSTTAGAQRHQRAAPGQDQAKPQADGAQNSFPTQEADPAKEARRCTMEVVSPSHTDLLGSYTGKPWPDPYETPTQDADDL